MHFKYKRLFRPLTQIRFKIQITETVNIGHEQLQRFIYRSSIKNPETTNFTNFLQPILRSVIKRITLQIKCYKMILWK